MEFTHFDEDGNARMVDVGDKDITKRRAIAEGRIQVGPEVMKKITSGTVKKGDVLSVAQLAAIMGAKRTSDLIPLCHPLALTKVDVHCKALSESNEVEVRAIVETKGRTGVEMEALTAVQVGLLTVYDMCKAVTKTMVIGPVYLLEKEGGKSGHFVRQES